MKLSKSFWQTYKESPADAQVPSHQLLLRAGFIYKTAGGLYSYLPMAMRVLSKIENIVREELEQIGAQEVLMSFVTPASLWKQSGRWDTMGPLMARLQDRKENEFCLSATNEETITDIFKHTVNSYKNLPVNLYQMNTKFRDELRPRFGILRAREFIMKDAYSFHESKECLAQMYQKYYEAYCRIFSRMGLEYIAVLADGGAIADSGAQTHEFQVIADTGEDDIVTVPGTSYAANIETAQTLRGGVEPAPSSELKDISTPNLQTCEQVANLLNIPVYQTLKTVVYTVTYPKKEVNYMLLILGDDEINEVKLENYFKGAKLIRMASEETLKELGLPIGYMGPFGKEGVSVVLDQAISVDAGYVIGANKVDYHLGGFTPSRDLESFKQADLRLAREDDVAQDGKTPIKLRKGIEVGQVFQLGDKYTKSMDASVLNEKGQKVFPFMGCYGIGVSRTLAATIEQHHDEKGMVWPVAIAPYHVHFCLLGKKEETKKLSEEIYQELQVNGFEVVFDDRGLGAGGMFKDADLLGLPVRLLLGERDYEKNQNLELKIRKNGQVYQVKKEDLVSRLNEIFSDLRAAV